LGKGFFTMTHKPINIKRSMKTLYNQHDSYSIKMQVELVAS
jgi:hypothetical protein